MKKIIFVDDDTDIQDLIKLVFETSGYELEVFTNGLPVLEDGKALADLIILDKQLPDIDGLELCKKLKKDDDTKETPVIMLSANPNIKKLSIEAGADESIEKPFSIKALKKMVEKYIN